MKTQEKITLTITITRDNRTEKVIFIKPEKIEKLETDKGIIGELLRRGAIKES